MRNPYLRTLIPLALICSGVDAVPLSATDSPSTPATALTPRGGQGVCPGQSGPGVMLTNKGSTEQTIYFFKNHRNGNGWADPEFNTPDPEVPSVTIAPGETKYAKTPYDWKGRAQRGKLQPATWAEFQIQDSDNNGRQADGKAHGNVSLIQGCDGAVTVSSTDGQSHNGFTDDCRAGAPKDALETKADGIVTVGRIVQNWPGSNKNPAAVTWLPEKVKSTQAYMLGPDGNAASSGVPDVAGADNCLKFDIY